MIWFVITDEEMDQTPAGKATNLLAGTAAQITDTLKRYKEAGLTMPLLWPPFADVPVAKTLDDLKRLKEEIMPKVESRVGANASSTRSAYALRRRRRGRRPGVRS